MKSCESGQESISENLSLRKAIVELGYMGADEFDKLVQPEKMIRPTRSKNNLLLTDVQYSFILGT
ncbi:MAG: hypothetical protein CM1200mP10_09830 [Candidatus Neomarinimicrobiota bacterium]|nr:MAG: hypothetical protein CM1200mP10_09830 [Candidatus Neomarinimicrobiota bacterium]